MTSHRRTDNDHLMFSSKTPHFFKVILQDSVRDGVLGIPRRFVRKYGNQLPSIVKLEVPSGAVWQVELTKSDETVRLQKGWREFAEHYSLEFGSFVVFRYEGNGRFHVLIFDRSASEIEYACTRTEHDGHDVSASGKRKENSNLSNPVPRKKLRTDSKSENVSSHISLDDPNSGKIKLGNLKKNENSCNSKGQVYGVGGGITVRQRAKTVSSCSQKLTPTEKAQAIQIASAFKSTDNPVFMVFMRPSSVQYRYRLHIPSDFARKFLTEHNGNLTISNSTGKIWPVKYYCNPENKNPDAQFHSGWRTFVEDNHLDVGDICVFELIKNPEILMKVEIHPVVKNASKTCRPQAHKTVGRGVRTRSLASETKPDCQQGWCSSSSVEFKYAKLENHKKSKGKHDNEGESGALGCPKPDIMGKMEPPTSTEKQACIRASAFKPGNPSFNVVMRPSYVLTDVSLNIPYQFAKRYFKKSGEITLRVSDGRTWIMNYKRNVTKAKFLRNNWRAFVLDNNLKVGDTCVFELLNENENLLEVTIFSVSDTASWSSSRLASRKRNEKSHLPCPLPRKKTRTNSPNQPGTNLKVENLSSGISSDHSKSSRISIGNLKKLENSPGQLVGNVERTVKPEAFSCLQRFTAIEKARAVQIASASKNTGNPVFMVVMQPTYVGGPFKMFIPSDFARKYLMMHKCNMTLCDSAGKTWPATYYSNPKYRNLKAHIYGGWQAFVKDNHLDVGDICVFELIRHPEILMKVVIYPVVENVSNACKPPAHGSIASRVKTRSLVRDTEPDCQLVHCPSSSRKFKDQTDSYIEILDDSPLNQKTKKKLTSPCFQPCKMVRSNPSENIQAEGIKLEKQVKSKNIQYITEELGGELKYSAKDDRGGATGARRCLKPDLLGKIKMQPMSKGASNFRTSNPSFSVVMRPSYVNSNNHLVRFLLTPLFNPSLASVILSVKSKTNSVIAIANVKNIATAIYISEIYLKPCIPEEFARRYLKKNEEIILRVPDGRTWTVQYERRTITNEHRRKGVFHSRSWRPFAIENELKVGDVCIFELIKENGNLLEVVILSATDIPSLS
ncbi:hypothetical protein V6N13_127746 [Hibiscus sabdariffa]